MTMVERVARAVYAEVDLTRKPFEACSLGYRRDMLRMARAALETMREPPDSALGIHALMDQDRARHIRVDWSRVINAVLREET
jgi:hypothetical protein